MIGLETIAERRDRLLREHGRANAETLRAEFWQRKEQQQGEGAIPRAHGEGEGP
jgi:hypothetical protein